MKRTLRKRAGLWELSVPLRAPVRGIWRYPTFEEAWGHLWRNGYPPGLPGEIKMAVGSAEPLPPGIEYVADVDDVKELVPDVIPPVDEPKPYASAWISRWISRAIAVGLGLTILLVILWWPLRHGGSGARRAVADATVPNAASGGRKPAENPVPPPASGPAKSHASIRTNDRSWITACVDGKVVFSKLFTTGSQESVDFMEYAVVRMGDAGPVEITLDGKPVGPLGRTGQVRVIELGRGTPHFLVGGEADDCTLAKSR